MGRIFFFDDYGIKNKNKIPVSSLGSVSAPGGSR